MFPNVRKAHPRHFSLTRFISLLQNKPLEQKAGVITTNQSLVLQKIDRKLSGSFTCQGVNAIGKGSSQEVFLDVKCEDKFFSLFSEFAINALAPFSVSLQGREKVKGHSRLENERQRWNGRGRRTVEIPLSICGL